MKNHLTRLDIENETGFYFTHHDPFDGSEIYKHHENKNWAIARYDGNFFISLSDDGSYKDNFSTSSTGRFINTLEELMIVMDYLKFLKTA